MFVMGNWGDISVEPTCDENDIDCTRVMGHTSNGYRLFEKRYYKTYADTCKIATRYAQMAEDNYQRTKAIAYKSVKKSSKRAKRTKK